VWLRIFSLGGEGEALYPRVEGLLAESGIRATDSVIVRNPAGYYISTSRSAFAIPYGGVERIRAVSENFDARFLVLEEQAAVGDVLALYRANSNITGFRLLGEVERAKVYRIETD
jgi:hypothetical protein